MADDPLDKLDYYDLLRIDPEANADQVRTAFHDFAMRYHPDRFVGAEDEKRERAAAIYRRGAEGYRVLTDPEQRKRYDAGLTEGRFRYAEPPSSPNSTRPAPGSVEVKTLRARPFVQKALQMIKAEDFKGAKLNLSLALNYEPENPQLLAKLEEVKQKLAAR